jgi:hypothetical protein
MRENKSMSPENSLLIKTPMLELNAIGSFTIGTLAALFLIYFAVLVVRRKG